MNNAINYDQLPVFFITKNNNKKRTHYSYKFKFAAKI